MSFDWGEYLILANELAGDAAATACEEARLRCALSRGYYSAYNAARMFADNQGYIKPANQGSHEALISYFQHDLSKPDRILVGQDLDRLRVLRVAADYHPVMPPNRLAKQNVLNQLYLAENIRVRLQTLT